MVRIDCPNCGVDFSEYVGPYDIVSGCIEIECPECHTKIPISKQNQKLY